MARRITKGVAASATCKTTKRLNVEVDEDAHELLYLHAYKADIGLGELVSKAIRESCRMYHVRANPVRTQPTLPEVNNRPEAAGPVIETAAA